MDQVRIQGLRSQTRIGTTKDERAHLQAVVVNIDVACDLRRAGASDELAHTIDYGRLAETVGELVRSSESKLLEHLAAKIASVVVDTPGAQAVDVEVIKAKPPTAGDVEVEAASVRIER